MSITRVILKCKLFVYNLIDYIHFATNQCNTCWLSYKIIELNWFEIYLSNKTFFLLLNEFLSVPVILNCGFLHGSVLEFIFLLHKMTFLKHCQKHVLIYILATLVFLTNINILRKLRLL